MCFACPLREPQVLKSRFGACFQVGEPCDLTEFPSVGQPGGQITFGNERQVDERLGEVDLRVNLMPPAGRGEARQDGRRAAAACVADEEAVFAVQHDTFHLALADVVIDRDGAIGTEHIQFFPLSEGVADGLCHGMLGQ